MDDIGFTPGEGSSDNCYWIESDYKTGNVWVPQYLSMQIVGPEGDATRPTRPPTTSTIRRSTRSTRPAPTTRPT